MDLFLDHTQRLNLHLMMGAQRGSVDEIRLWWRLQDLIALDDQERTAIEYRTVRFGDAEQPQWNPSKVSSRRYEFTTDEIERIRKLIKEWQHGFAASDRLWLEPLLAQLEVVSGADEVAIHSGNSQGKH